MARGSNRAGAPPSAGDVELQAIEPLKIGGKRHEPGAMVTVSAEEAAQLVASGAARSRADAEAAAQEAQQAGDDELRLSS